MEYEKARDQAKRTGGTLNWSKEQGWYVEPQYRARPTSWYERIPIFPWQGIGAWPWETVKGEGFLAPWQTWYKTPEDKFTSYQYGTPQIGWEAQQRLAETQTPIPEWLMPLEPTQAQLRATKKPQTEEDKTDDMLRQMLLDIQKRQAGMWEMGVPGGGEFGQITKLSNGSTGYWIQDPNTGIPQFVQLTQPTEEERAISPEQKAQLDWQQQQAELARQQWEEQFKWQQQQWQQQQEMAQKQRLAELAANPMSWLQYGLESGLGSQVQPWMVPLMQGAPQVGQPLTTGQETTLEGMPQLTQPSAQYWAKMAPSAQQQYFGYEQARTGAKPADVEATRWMRSAPSGRFPGFPRRW